MTQGLPHTILVVDDNDGVRGLLEAILHQAGHCVVTAANGNDALARLSVVIPDLIISDCAMPGMGGDELFRAIKCNRRTNRIPFVVVTGVVDRLAKQRLFEGAIDAFLLKPFDSHSVIETVGRFLRRIRVLVVDQDSSVREMLGLALGQLGFDLTTAADGGEALELLDERNIDLLLLDGTLPAINGVSLVRALRGIEPMPDSRFERVCSAGGHLPILLTGSTDSFESLPEEIRREVDGFVPKPYDLSDLGVRIRLTVGRNEI